MNFTNNKLVADFPKFTPIFSFWSYNSLLLFILSFISYKDEIKRFLNRFLKSTDCPRRIYTMAFPSRLNVYLMYILVRLSSCQGLNSNNLNDSNTVI